MSARLPRDLEGLLEAAGRPVPLARNAEERSRTANRIAKIGAGSALLAALTSYKAIALAAIGITTGGVVIAATMYGGQPAPAARPVTPIVHLPPASPVPEPAPVEPAIADPSPTPVVEQAAPRARHARVSPAASSEREHQILDRAFATVARDPQAALTMVNEHAAAFPHGQLVAEREFLAVDALSRLGRTGQARARARSLLARFPTTIYRERVQRVLDETP